MSVTTLHELNQRYVRLTDRCRSQWTFYQFLQGVFKHLREAACPLVLDFPALFNELRDLGAGLGHAETSRTEKTLSQLTTRLDGQARQLLDVDEQVPPSMLRRFFDRLRNQDEKVLLAIIKVYLDAAPNDEDIFDKLDILFTRLAEIPRADGASLVRERHELERLIQPLLHPDPATAPSDHEVEILLHALADLKEEVLASRRFTELVAGGALDRFRSFKRRLGPALLHPRMLPEVLETTVAIKNHFREVWEEEEGQLLSDTNRVRELSHQLEKHPELISPSLGKALDMFAEAHRRFDAGRQGENLRRGDALELRLTLDRVMEQSDLVPAQPPAVPDAVELSEHGDGVAANEVSGPVASLPAQQLGPDLLADPLLHEYLSKIHFALELAGRDRSPSEAVHAREVVALRLEPWEVEAARGMVDGPGASDSLTGEQSRLLLRAAALRIRMDEEAHEIDRLQKRGSDRLPDLLEAAAQSLQRAAELDRRFLWLVEDALFRGETESLERLYRSRFRLLHAYSSLWLMHSDRGGISPF
ncbi:MAG: hypothetical protein ACHQQS_08420 [Thermoanaerobaculales bacterium]